MTNFMYLNTLRWAEVRFLREKYTLYTVGLDSWFYKSYETLGKSHAKCSIGVNLDENECLRSAKLKYLGFRITLYSHRGHLVDEKSSKVFIVVIRLVPLTFLIKNLSKFPRVSFWQNNCKNIVDLQHFMLQLVLCIAPVKTD